MTNPIRNAKTAKLSAAELQTALRQLREIIAQVDAGELKATKSQLAYIAGSMDAIRLMLFVEID